MRACMRMAATSARQVHFLGVQRGKTEQQFFARIVPILNDDGAVKRTFLARVMYESPPEVIVL